jgi:hypothetical protein
MALLLGALVGHRDKNCMSAFAGYRTRISAQFTLLDMIYVAVTMRFQTGQSECERRHATGVHLGWKPDKLMMDSIDQPRVFQKKHKAKAKK